LSNTCGSTALGLMKESGEREEIRVFMSHYRENSMTIKRRSKPLFSPRCDLSKLKAS
jgi:hypothetical protein